MHYVFLLNIKSLMHYQELLLLLQVWLGRCHVLGGYNHTHAGYTTFTIDPYLPDNSPDQWGGGRETKLSCYPPSPLSTFLRFTILLFLPPLPPLPLPLPPSSAPPR